MVWLHSSRIPRTTQWRLGLCPDAVNHMFDCLREDNNSNCFVSICAGDEPLPARGAHRKRQIPRDNDAGGGDTFHKVAPAAALMGPEGVPWGRVKGCAGQPSAGSNTAVQSTMAGRGGNPTPTPRCALYSGVAARDLLQRRRRRLCFFCG